MSDESRELIEVPESTAMAQMVAEGDPELMLAVMEKKAKLAVRMREAKEQILVSQTYPSDWTIQGDKACLNSAGAERVGANFPINFEDVKHLREEFVDELGKGYRYVFTGYAQLYDRKTYVEGRYSTRDAFLGKADGKWRALEDINEGNIRAAAYHTFVGNAIKALLGLRGIPRSEYERIMQRTGADTSKTGSVDRGRGTQGGTSAEDSGHQRELAELCIEIAKAGQTVHQDTEGNFTLTPLSDGDAREALEIAKDICVALSSFRAKDGKEVRGKGAKDLTGKWLNGTLAKARKLAESLDKEWK